jgi:hypothetical protein
VFTLATTAVRAGDIGFFEDYALSKDKGAALKQLIPRTEDYTAKLYAKVGVLRKLCKCGSAKRLG